MKKYLDEHPDDSDIVGALRFSYGDDETEEICNKAVVEGKRIKIEENEEQIDHCGYSLH